MIMRFDIQGLAEIQQRLATLTTQQQTQVMVPAINKVATAARAEMTRAITTEYAISARSVRSSVDIQRASRNRVTAQLDIFGSPSRRGRSQNLIHFLAAVQTSRGAQRTRGSRATRRELQSVGQQLGFRIKRNAGLKQIEGAFVGNKGRTIFKRTTAARLPIEPVQVIGVSQMFNSRQISQRILDKIAADLPIEFDRALARLLARGGTP